jgi:putative component of toxin-antitoxin plasmid stabilization module
VDRKREIHFYKAYFTDFFDSLTERVKDKIDHVLFVISVTDRIPVKFFKHIEGTEGLYEVRVEYGSNIYRIFACFDQGHLVVLFNGFQKKLKKRHPRKLKRL